MRNLFAAFFVLSLSLSAAVQAQGIKPLDILRVTPQGEDVAAAQQIVIEFNRAVVPVGRMDRTAEEVGVTVTPSLACQWRWINTSTLACNLDGDTHMVESTEYKVDIRQGVIKAEDGGSLPEAKSYTFTTIRPEISYYNFVTWRGATTPVIRIVFNQPVTKSSATQHLYFQEVNLPKQLVSLSPDPDDSEAAIKHGEDEARRVWLVEPRKPLAADATGVMLMMEPGIVSPLGPEASVARRDIVTFNTYPEFRFIGLQCTNNEDVGVLIEPGKPQTPDQLCNPMRPASLAFSVPVLRSEVSSNVTFSPDLAGGRKGYNPWGDENRDWSRLDQPYSGSHYFIGLPIGLKAAQQYTITVPSKKPGIKAALSQLMGKDAKEGMQDEFGRTLMKPVKLVFSTNHRPPNFELVHKEAVLEKNVDSEVPLYVNNLQSYSLNYRRVNIAGVQADQSYTQTVPSPEDVQFAVPLGVREMLGDKPGVIYGHLQTEPQIPNYNPSFARLFAQVTPFQVHLKLGHFQSVAWVTDLATGQPVEGAQVVLYKDELSDLSIPETTASGNTTDANGVALLPGTAEVDPDNAFTQAWREEDPRLFLRVDKGEDMALMPLSYDFYIDTWRASNETIWSDLQKKYGHLKSWGMTAQGVYRAGDTMEYKIFVRDQNNLTLVPPPSDAKYTLEILDAANKSLWKGEDIKLSEFGAYAGIYSIPKNAAVGWYRFELTVEFPGEETRTYEPLRVLVSDFTVAPFRVTSEMNGDHFKAGDKVDLHADAKMHAGGAYTDASVRVMGIVKSKRFESRNPTAQGFIFDSFQEGNSDEQIFEKSAPLDDKGEWNESFILPAINIAYGTLELEAGVQDDRGKTIANVSRADYFGVDRLVGIKSTQWVYEAKKPAVLPIMVVDDKGDPVAGVPIRVTLEKEIINTARVKGAGNAYLSDVTTEWKQLAHCDLTSKPEGESCTFAPDSAGTFRLTAEISDTKGVKHKTTVQLWATGDDYVQWNSDADSALTIVPEKSEYRIGDTAKYLIKNPYPGTKALVTIERYGVIDTFVMPLEGSTPTIEFPVKPDYMPGFYLSVVVVSPRVEAPPAEEGQIDLGKPTFRMGYVTVPVKDPVKEMQVDVKVAQDVYRPRDKVKLDLTAVPRLEMAEKQPIELTVAVVDEAVFDLISGGRSAYDPYEGFYSLESLDLRNYSLMMRLVGRQKFEKKGANPGGDGGTDVDMRTLFKYVSYWNPGVKTDESGKASVEFEAPDNLTGWRVLVLATTPGDRLGLGEDNFKVNRPTEVRPVMPNQVREGDEFKAGFSVMNRTDTARTIHVSIEASGDLKGEPAQTKAEEVHLEPYKRAIVYMDLNAAILPVSREIPEGKINFKATAADADDSDGTVYTLPLYKSRITDVGASYGTTTEEKVQESIAFPEGIYTDTGDVSVVLSPSVIANLDGAFRYMRDYPYTCWEQTITRGVMASHYNQLKAYLPEGLVWEGSNTLPQEMLERATDYQAPNGGMTYFIPRDEYVDPYLSAYTALAFRWLAKAGYEVPEAVETKLQAYLENFLKQDAAPSFYQAGMTSTVRAVALAALVDAGKAGKDDVLRFEPHVKGMSLFGKALFMQAAIKAGGLETETRSVADMIFAAGNETGGKFNFNETLDNGYERILTTALRDNCSVLDAFMDYAATDSGQEIIGDKPFKLVRSITQSRGSRDHWENTQENMFCMNALVNYAKRYESETPDMTVKVNLDSKEIGQATFKSIKDESQTVSRDIVDGDAGRKTTIDILKEGPGRLYYATRMRYALMTVADKEVNAGMDIRREYHIKRDGKWVLMSDADSIKRGDTVRVDLFINAPSARNFVVVNDPLPGGLETVNRDLATASAVDADEGLFDQAGGSFWFKYGDWHEYGFSRWSFYHKELRHDSARFYADRIEEGNYHLSYVAQAIADGSFQAPSARVEEMYDPDVYGRSLSRELKIQTDSP